MARNMCTKNQKNKYEGKVKCKVCGEGYNWVEDENAELIVKDISDEGKNTFIDFELIARCPICKHKSRRLVSADGKGY